MGLICCKHAYAADSFIVNTPEELMQIAASDYYQHILMTYRHTGNRELKEKLFAIIPQGVRRDVNNTRHWAIDLRPSGVIFADDDRPHSEISAEERHQLVEQRLAERGLAHLKHTGMRSSSGKYHLLIEALDPTKSFIENHLMVEELFSGVLVLDKSTRVVNKLLFLTGEVFGGISSLEWLFAPHNCLEDVNFNDNVNVDDNDNDDDNYHPDGNFQFSILNFQLEKVVESLTRQLNGGSLDVHVGTRNTLIYSVFRQLCYLDLTEDSMVDALRPLHFYGLDEREVRSACRSAMKHERTWKYQLPPQLQVALSEIDVNFNDNVDDDDNDNDNDNDNVDDNDNIADCHPEANCQLSIVNCQLSIPPCPPRLIQLFEQLVPEHVRPTLGTIIFPALGSYLNNSAWIRDVSGARHNLAFISLLVGSPSAGKSASRYVSDYITERWRLRDKTSWELIEKFQAERRSASRGDKSASSLPPKVPIRLLSPNMTEASLIFRMQCLESSQSRAYIQCNELSDLYKMQSVSTARNGQQAHGLILGAFDTAPYSSLRVGADCVSAMTTLSLNILSSTTYVGAREFCGEASVANGCLSRLDVAICPDCYELPRYTDPTQEFFDELGTYIDRIEQCTGEIRCEELDQCIEAIRQSYNDPESPYSPNQNVEAWRLAHRQLLYTKMKGALLFVANGHAWDPSWEPWLSWSFQNGMASKLQVFGPLIESYQRKQELAANPYVSMRTRKSELTQLPNSFSLNDLCSLKRQTNPTASDEEIRLKAATQLRMWRLRQKVVQVNDQEWQKL